MQSESVIPADVIDHLRELARREASLDGAFTTKMLAEEMDIGDAQARDIIRQLAREKKVHPRRICLTDQQALEMGYLGGTSIRCYEWVA